MSSPLIAGRLRRRRRGPRRLGVLALVVAVVTAGLSIGAGRLDDRDAAAPRGAAASAPALGPLPEAAPPRPAHPSAVTLEGADAFRVRFGGRPPRSALVFDMRSGRVLWRRRPLDRLPVASLTKIMTALLVAERTSSRERVRITRSALAYRGQGIGLLPRGRRVPIEALLHGLLLTSGNDAAIALADHVAGSERRFARLMNHRAAQLGLACTRFVSSHGLEAGNRSCAADLAALTRVAMREVRVARVARKPEAALRFPIRRGRLFVTSTNPLVRGRYRGAIGLKTGYTVVAGRCLVGVARRGRRTLGIVLLGSPDPGGQARRLLDRAFRTP